MTQVDPQVTTLRLAGGFEMTCPAGRPVYLPSLHVTSGENYLEHSTSTVISLAKQLPGWLHASQVIMLQFYTTLLLSIVTQPATSSYEIDYHLGDPASHITAYPAAEIETPRLMQCSAKPPDNSHQHTSQSDRLVLKVPIVQVRPCQVTELLIMPYITSHNINKHLTDILLLGITIHATISSNLSPMHRTFIMTLYLLNRVHDTPTQSTQSNKIQMYDCGGQYGHPQVQPFSLNTTDHCRNTSTLYLPPMPKSVQVVQIPDNTPIQVHNCLIETSTSVGYYGNTGFTHVAHEMRTIDE